MNRLMFFLSGENPTLPVSEVIGAIEAENYQSKIIDKFDQVLVLETNADPVILSERLGMSHWIGEHYCTTKPEDILEAVGSSDIIDDIPHSESIAVRIKRVKQYSMEIDCRELTRSIADQILEGVDFKVDLTNPDNEINGVLTEDLIVLGVVKARVNRSQFEKRRPKNRAAVHPGTLQPSFARALINLARTPKNGYLLDPFCGVGGILLEAGLIGSKVIGIDINPEMIKGAEKNLEEVQIKDFNLKIGDARKMRMDKVDAIVTDPPYGRQASTAGSRIDELYRDALPILSQNLKTGNYICISAPSKLDFKSIMENHDLELIESHDQRVHKDLTRKIYVLKRN